MVKRKREARRHVVAVRGEERSRPSAGKVARVGFIDRGKLGRSTRRAACASGGSGKRPIQAKAKCSQNCSVENLIGWADRWPLEAPVPAGMDHRRTCRTPAKRRFSTEQVKTVYIMSDCGTPGTVRADRSGAAGRGVRTVLDAVLSALMFVRSDCGDVRARPGQHGGRRPKPTGRITAREWGRPSPGTASSRRPGPTGA